MSTLSAVVMSVISLRLWRLVFQVEVTAMVALIVLQPTVPLMDLHPMDHPLMDLYPMDPLSTVLPMDLPPLWTLFLWFFL